MSLQKLFSYFIFSLLLLPIGVSGVLSYGEAQPIQKPLLTNSFHQHKNSVDVKLSVNKYKSLISRKYLLGPNDIISIAVYDAPEFDHEKVRIQPDGKIVIAPLGSLEVAGITLDELEMLLIKELKYYLNDPKVTIKLENTKPFTVYISGAVLNPGSFEVVTDSLRNQFSSDGIPEVSVERRAPLLSSILVAAGGVSYDADLAHIQVENRIEGSTFEVNLLELIQDARKGNDVYLVAGDTIHVPKLPTPYALSSETYQEIKGSTVFQKQIPVRVYGYVNRPGLIQLDPSQSANLNSAIASAGGYLTEVAYAPMFVYLSRVDGNGRLTTTKINPKRHDTSLMPNDIVYVPEKPRPAIGKAADFLGRLVAPFGDFARAYNSWALIFDPTRFSNNSTNNIQRAL